MSKLFDGEPPKPQRRAPAGVRATPDKLALWVVGRYTGAHPRNAEKYVAHAMDFGATEEQARAAVAVALLRGWLIPLLGDSDVLTAGSAYWSREFA